MQPRQRVSTRTNNALHGSSAGLSPDNKSIVGLDLGLVGTKLPFKLAKFVSHASFCDDLVGRLSGMGTIYCSTLPLCRMTIHARVRRREGCVLVETPIRKHSISLVFDSIFGCYRLVLHQYVSVRACSPRIEERIMCTRLQTMTLRKLRRHHFAVMSFVDRERLNAAPASRSNLIHALILKRAWVSSG